MTRDEVFTIANKNEDKGTRNERLKKIHEILRNKATEFSKLSHRIVSFPPKIGNVEVVALIIALRQCGMNDLTDELLEDTYNMLLNKLLDGLIEEAKKTELMNKIFIPGRDLKH